MLWSTTTLAMICNGGNEMALLFSRATIGGGGPSRATLAGSLWDEPVPPYHIISAPGLLRCKNSRVETMQPPFEVWMSLMLSVSNSDLAHVT